MHDNIWIEFLKIRQRNSTGRRRMNQIRIATTITRHQREKNWEHCIHFVPIPSSMDRPKLCARDSTTYKSNNNTPVTGPHKDIFRLIIMGQKSHCLHSREACMQAGRQAGRFVRRSNKFCLIPRSIEQILLSPEKETKTKIDSSLFFRSMHGSWKRSCAYTRNLAMFFLFQFL